MTQLSTPFASGPTQGPVSAAPGLPALLAGAPHLPYPLLTGVCSEQRAAYLTAQIVSAQQRGAATFVAGSSGACSGVIQLESLPWDSQWLGRAVGRIPCWIESTDVSAKRVNGLLDSALQEARRLGMQYLWTRTPSACVTQLQTLESCGFQTVDSLLTFGIALPASPDTRADPALEYGLVREAEIADVGSIAAESFTVDRFHSDPTVAKAVADELHRQWAINCCHDHADAVLVARNEGNVVGFIALRIDRLAESVLGARTGTIILVATSVSARRMGVATSLSRAALQWFTAQGCVYAEVGTQLANLRAARLYQSAGFRLAQASVTLRLLL